MFHVEQSINERTVKTMYKTIEEQIFELMAKAMQLAKEHNCTIYVDTPDAERGMYGLPIDFDETSVSVTRH